jgi:hypothetical protein
MSKRSKIVTALQLKLQNINGTGEYSSNLFSNVFTKLVFWDEVDDYPSVYLNAGSESREYLPGSFKWAYLNISVRIYVEEESPEEALEKIFEDIEKVVDASGNLVFDSSTGDKIEDMRILSINTDEGLLSPIGVGEVNILVQYEVSTCN